MSEKPIDIFKALADETRLKILQLLMKGELCVCMIFPQVDRTQPTVSNQLRVLESAGIIASRRDGRNILYSIKDQRIKEILKILKVK